MGEGDRSPDTAAVADELLEEARRMRPDTSEEARARAERLGRMRHREHPRRCPSTSAILLTSDKRKC
jgi:hypothetical protein